MPNTIGRTAAITRTSRRFVRDGALAHSRADRKNDRDAKASTIERPAERAATVSEHIDKETHA